MSLTDFILSDNLVGVLERRPDAVLSGSFLWHEVIAAYADVNKACRKFVERDIRLLQSCTPHMICNADLATPAVLSMTRPVLVPWMVEDFTEFQVSEKVNASPIEPTAVLVHGGGTRTLDKRVRAIAESLRANHYIVYTDLVDDSMCFDYQDSTWQRLGVVICRPGVGTATECVKWSIPMIVLRDHENLEAEFVAKRLKHLGLAHGGEIISDDEKVINLVGELLSIDKRVAFLKPFTLCKRTGIYDAANFLAQHWRLEEGSG